MYINNCILIFKIALKLNGLQTQLYFNKLECQLVRREQVLHGTDDPVSTRCLHVSHWQSVTDLDGPNQGQAGSVWPVTSLCISYCMCVGINIPVHFKVHQVSFNKKRFSITSTISPPLSIPWIMLLFSL